MPARSFRTGQAIWARSWFAVLGLNWRRQATDPPPTRPTSDPPADGVALKDKSDQGFNVNDVTSVFEYFPCLLVNHNNRDHIKERELVGCA